MIVPGCNFTGYSCVGEVSTDENLLGWESGERANRLIGALELVREKACTQNCFNTLEQFHAQKM